MKVYYRVKCNLFGSKALAHTNISYRYGERGKKIIVKKFISVFLPRSWMSYARRQVAGINHAWDEYFSYIMSHEYIHSALYDIGEFDASSKFDNIAGRVPKNPFDARIGMPMADKKTRQALKEDYPGMV